MLKVYSPIEMCVFVCVCVFFHLRDNKRCYTICFVFVFKPFFY